MVVLSVVGASLGKYRLRLTYRTEYGNATPAALRQFIEESYTSTSPHLFASMRVQLGRDDSFFAWTKCLWICHNIPTALKELLIDESTEYSQSHEGLVKGLFKYQPPTHVSWHENGSYYYQTNEGHLWNFQSNITQNGWTTLWHNRQGDDFTAGELTNLAVSTILFVDRISLRNSHIPSLLGSTRTRLMATISFSSRSRRTAMKRTLLYASLQKTQYLGSLLVIS
jgi:hypothetical protein